MAKAAADQEAAVREAEANQIKINADRDVSVRRAETEMQVAAAEARAAQAGPLAQAEAQQEVTRKQTELAQLEADRTQKELVATTVRPAEADADAQVRRAEGEKLAQIAQAQAEAERVKLAGQAEASITIAKGEAQARVVEVNAEAEAKKTTLEGNAEAGITFTKGEAEAKALAMRADAYRQFTEAAIIQTVLSQLPDIVRAAAEPMSNIGNLTILSSDGASDVVKTTTRTVAEAGAAVKGLTGIDIPALLSSAMGASTDGARQGPAGGSGGPGRGGGDGGGRRPRTAPPSPTAPASEPGAPPATTPPAQAGPAIDPATAFARAGEAMSRAGRTISETVRSIGPSDVEPAAEAASTPSRDATTDRAIAPPRPSARASAPRSTASGAAGSGAAGSAATAARRAGVPAESLDIGRETPLDEAAFRLANDLRAVPGIERFAHVRLSELQRSGPRPLRVLWRIASDQLDARYGSLTIGELLDRSQGSGGAAAGR